MKTKLEIINETVEYYSQDPHSLRAVNEFDKCDYLVGATGNMCAVGRCMIKPTLDMEGSVLRFTIAGKLDNIEDYLKPEYRGHDARFWRNLQELHDNKIYWGNSGLTSEGQQFVEVLKSDYPN